MRLTRVEDELELGKRFMNTEREFDLLLEQRELLGALESEQ